MREKKLLYVTPHLSTGGMPQYLLKQIEKFKDSYDIDVVEVANHSPHYVVQKNRIKDLGIFIGTLPEDKSKLVDIVKDYDIIHFTEIPEHYLSHDVLDEIFDNDNRTYDIVCSTHGSGTNPDAIKYHPDRYVLVSEWSRKRFEHLGIDTKVWEYPVYDNQPNYITEKRRLGLDPNYKHVLMVGLFTPGKNQKEIFEVARELEEYPVKFHFVGNQAGNFKDYWEPLMKDKPDNCIVWGERDDVDSFYQACNLFYFSSKLELNPLSIKEALSWNLPIIMRKLPTYLDTYDDNDLVTYIDSDVEKTKDLLIDELDLESEFDSDHEHDSITVVLAYADTEFRKNLLKKCLSSISTKTILSSHYPVDEETQRMADWTIYEKDNPLLYQKDFSKYVVDYWVYHTDKNGVQTKSYYEWEHSFAVYTLIRSGIRYAKTLGYDKINIVNYDYELNSDILKRHEKYLDNNDIVFYAYDPDKVHDFAESVSTGFFSGKVHALSDYFEYHTGFRSFYGQDSKDAIFEKKVRRYYYETNPMYKIKTLDFQYLDNTIKTNQEGIFQFSNDPEKETKQMNNTDIITRTDIINTFIKKYDYKSYLEIGLADGNNFKNVDIEFKESVDPAETSEGRQGTPTYKMTSDEFFSMNRKRDRKYDIIFIDGLHHSEQVDKDIHNSIVSLNQNGTIILHDCNPQTEISQVVPRKSTHWHGDVWKSFVKFKYNNHSWDCYTIDTDSGCGIIRPKLEIEYPLEFEWLNNNRKEVLGLISPEEFKKRL